MKKIITLFVFAALICTSVFAENAEVSMSIKMDYKAKTLIVSGETEKENTAVTLNILNPGKTSKDLINKTDGDGIILFCGDIQTGENGKFEFKVKIPDNTSEGLCTVYLAMNGETPQIKKIYYQSMEQYSDLIDKINSSANVGYDAFLKMLNENTEKLLFESEYDNAVSSKEIANKLLWNYSKNPGFEREDSAGNSDLYKKAILLQAVSEGKLNKNNGFAEKLEMFDDKLIEDYKKYITDISEGYFFSVINRNPDTFEAFKKSFKDSVILTAVRYPNGVDNVKKILEQYADYLGISTSDAALNDYSKISGESFEKIENLVLRFNAVKSERKKSAGSQGSGGGGTSSSKSPNIGSITAPEEVINSQKPNEIDMKFEDLNPVPWAYEAISELYSKNIVSGKTDTEFYPEANITREEFVKLLVCLLNLENEEYSPVFIDVKDDEWYASYVNIAYAHKICKGVADNIFGIGENITREDMAVMAYNVLNLKEINLNESDFKFADDSDFSDYSRDAVSALTAIKIVNGTGNNMFSPKAYATRAEAAVIIYNMLGQLSRL